MILSKTLDRRSPRLVTSGSWLLVVAAIVGCGPSPNTERAAVNSSTESHQEEPMIPAEHANGKAIYDKNCSLCHNTGEAAAPRLGNPLQWKKRAIKSTEELTTNAFDGFEGKWGEMPPQGDDLSREEVEAAVKYMLFRFEEANH